MWWKNRIEKKSFGLGMTLSAARWAAPANPGGASNRPGSVWEFWGEGDMHGRKGP